jgi:hypothetical protein
MWNMHNPSGLSLSQPHEFRNFILSQPRVNSGIKIAEICYIDGDQRVETDIVDVELLDTEVRQGFVEGLYCRDTPGSHLTNP